MNKPGKIRKKLKIECEFHRNRKETVIYAEYIQREREDSERPLSRKKGSKSTFVL